MIELKDIALDNAGEGAFYLMDGTEVAGELRVHLKGHVLRALHTEVKTRYEGQGLAKRLLEGLLKYARENGFKIDPVCPYVLAQFKKNRDNYGDVWHKLSA